MSAHTTKALSSECDASVPLSHLLGAVSDIERGFSLAALRPGIESCRRLLAPVESIGVAVLGAFKAGKSSFINTLVGAPLLPVDVLPTTSVLTLVTAGPHVAATLTLRDGAAQDVAVDEIAEWITQARNPDNRKGVRSVRIETPGLGRWPGLHFIDTPGTGSAFARNTAASIEHVPKVEAAVLTISCTQPVSADDLALLRRLAQTTPRCAVVLTKADIVPPGRLPAIIAFVDERLRAEALAARVFVWSERGDFTPARETFACEFLARLAAQRREVAQEIGRYKLRNLVRDSCALLDLGAAAARHSETDRRRLQERLDALCDGPASVRTNLARLERDSCNACLERTLAALERTQRAVRTTLGGELGREVLDRGGTIAAAARRFENWLRAKLPSTLNSAVAAIGRDVNAPLAEFVGECERVIASFHLHLADAVRAALGVEMPPPGWRAEVSPPERPDIDVAPTFMFGFDWLWSVVPLWCVRPIFRAHVRRRLAWEMEKNLSRLAAQWSDALKASITQAAAGARQHTAAQCDMLMNLLRQRSNPTDDWQQASSRLATMLAATESVWA